MESKITNARRSRNCRVNKLFNSVIAEEKFVESKLTTEKEDGVIIRSRESMYYYEIFKKLFGSPVEF